MSDTRETLFQIERAMIKRGLPKMPADTLKEVSKWIEHPEAQQKLSSGQMTPDMIADEVGKALQGMGVNVQATPPQPNIMPAQSPGMEPLRAKLRQRMI